MLRTAIEQILDANIRTFFVLAQTMSFKETSRRLEIGEPAVSRRLAALEKDLGVTLINRATRPVRLSNEGRYLYAQLQDKLKPLAEAVNSLQQRNNLKPALRMGCVESLSLDAMPALLRRMQPKVRSELCLTGTSDRLLQELLNEEIDVIVSSDPFLHVPGLRRRFLFGEPSVLMMPKTMASSHQGIWTWEDLKISGLPYIRYYRESGGGKLSETFLASIGLELSGTVEVDTNGLMLSLIAQGVGWTLTRTTSLLQHRILAPRVAVEPMPDPAMRREIYLIDRKNIPTSLQQNLTQELGKIFRDVIGPELSQIAPWVRNDLLINTSVRGNNKMPLFP